MDGNCNCTKGWGGLDCSLKGITIPSCNKDGNTIDTLFLNEK